MAAAHRILALLVALLVAAPGCGGNKKKERSGGQSEAEQKLAAAIEEETPPGLSMRISDGSPGGGRLPQVTPARATRLDDATSQKLLARMPAIAASADDQKEFALRDRSQPPPLTGATVNASFPPPPSNRAPPAVAADKAPLAVTRYAPEGEVPLAPNLSVSFSQPMIAVTSHADSVAGGVPVELTPQPAGKWRWIGTKTLLFDPEVRFPQATTYRVRIPAGTKAASGQALKEEVSFQFETPPVRLQSHFPDSEPQPLEPVMLATFDQEIDPAKVLAKIQVEAGGTSYRVRAATDAEIELDRRARPLVQAAAASEQSHRYVAFRVDRRLPADSQVVVTIAKGTPSAEGPNPTTEDQSFSFKTYGPLEIEQSRCAWGRDCPPLTPWTIRFSNPLDEEALDPDRFRIEPALPGRSLQVHGRTLVIAGASKGRTRYRVTVPAGLKDEFDQTLGKDQTVTFEVGEARPRLTGPSGLVVLDPAAKKPTLDIFTINYRELAVKLYAVTPADWNAFADYMSKVGRIDDAPSPPGRKVFDQVVKIDGPADELFESHLDLAPALPDGLGHVVAIVEPTEETDHYKPVLRAWIQSTRIGLDAFVDAGDLVAWANSLADGSPLEGVKLEIAPGGVSGTSDAQGVADLPLPAGAGGHQLLIARRGDDTAFLPENLYWWSDHGGWVRHNPGQSLRWFVFDDRQMYRPGETVHIKGWIRRTDNREGGDLSGLGGDVPRVTWAVTGSRGNDLLEGSAEVDALGGFDTRFTLPDTANLGYARLRLFAVGRPGGSHTHTFQIQEFRRPEFEVDATASPGPHILGGSADVTVKARYYAGGGLPNAAVNWLVTASPASFTPPNRGDFTFGTWVPWWRHDLGGRATSQTLRHQGKTDAVGSHVIHLDFVSMKPPRPMSVTANATVMDVNRQAWTASASLLVHPSDLYIGLKTERTFVARGKPIELQSIVVDQDGTAVKDRKIEIEAVRLEWAYEKGKWVEKERDPQSCSPRSAEDAVQCSFDTEQGGTYRITATVTDDEKRKNQSELTVWVAGGKQKPARGVEQETVALIPDKKSYLPGDTAELLVQAPFFPAEGVLSLRRSGIESTERFTMDGPTKTLTVKLEEGHVPNLHVQVDLVGAAARLTDDGEPNDALPKRPAYAVGTIDLPVPPTRRTLAVTVEPHQRKLEPGGKTELTVLVRDAASRPMAGAELAVVVVDESVLALTNYRTPDPIPTFYAERAAGGRDYHGRQYVTLARPDTDTLALGPGGAKGAGGLDRADDFGAGLPPPAPSAAPETEEAALAEGMVKTKSAERRSRDKSPSQANAPIVVRKNFDALATFAPAVRTDAAGRALVPVTVPDNLTRYRVMVVAVAGDKQFGSAESSITARMPLMVRPSPPRFLNFGDHFELPVVLQNQTDDPMTVQVAVRTTNASLEQGMGRQAEVPANDRVEVRFPVAAELAGTARFQIAAAAGRWADAAELALPVWTPATTEAFATYGEIDDGAVRQPIAMPGAVVEQFGGLEITTSSTQLQALTDAFLYLVAYPFECAEQLSSRVLAVAALRDVLTAFDAEGLPPPAEIEAAVARDLELLRGRQNGDGGFGFWRRGDESWPFVSIHVAHALTRAQEKGFSVDASMKSRSLDYLQHVEQHIPGWYPGAVRRSLIAYALYVRKRMGDPDPARARALIADAGLDGLSMEAVGWLLSVLSGDRGSQKQLAAIHRHLLNRVSETAGAANFTTSYADGNYLLLGSDRRADGIILEALILDQPKSELIPKLVRGLLAHRSRGRWGNSQENVWVLLALDRYFNVFEKTTPNFVARAWLGDKYAGDHRFRGRTTERYQIDIPMRYVAAAKQADLILAKQGKGRMYYRVGMTYAPADLDLPPADHGFAVQRRYEFVDDPGDVTRDADGVWHFKAGARVRVRLTMVAENRRYHVALVDPLPAGLEPMNPALAVTGAIPQDPSQTQNRGRYWWWYRTWYEHQNLRDERVEAFTSLLWEGVHQYSYVARATTPGHFVVPPTKAEEMYAPETFGRAASDKVIVE